MKRLRRSGEEWVDIKDEDIILGERFDEPHWPPPRMRRLQDGSVHMSGMLQGRRIMMRLPDGYRPKPGQLPPTKMEMVNPRFDNFGNLLSYEGVQYTSFFTLGFDVYIVVWQELKDVIVK